MPNLRVHLRPAGEGSYLLLTEDPQQIAVRPGEPVRDGDMIPIAVTVNGVAVAEDAVEPEQLERLQEVKEFDAPARLIFAIREDGGAVEGRLGLLAPSLASEVVEDEAPWEEQAHAFEDGRKEDVLPVVVLAMVRCDGEDRRHPTDTVAEGVQMFEDLLDGDLRSPEQQALQEFLRGL